MLLGQFIVAVMSGARRFDAVLLSLRDAALALAARLRLGDSDLQEG
jgi:hypothetical protein